MVFVQELLWFIMDFSRLVLDRPTKVFVQELLWFIIVKTIEKELVRIVFVQELLWFIDIL